MTMRFIFQKFQAFSEQVRMRLPRFSISMKLTVLTGSVTAFALVVVSAVMIFYGNEIAQSSKISQLSTLGRVLASNSAAALSFGQKESASELLKSAALFDTVKNIDVYDVDGNQFAAYDRPGSASWRPTEWIIDNPTITDDGYLEVFLPIHDGDDVIGVIGLRDSLDDLRATNSEYFAVCLLAFALSLAVGVALAVPLQRNISQPILQLADAAHRITKEMDFSLRVHRSSDDEIGELYSEFNNLVERVQRSNGEIQTAHAELEKLNHELEARVSSRTNLLEMANSELQEKIQQLDNANVNLKQAQASLIEISRKAGMADIANGVLHNIGNVLNSLNVSAGIVSDRLKGLNIEGLKKALALIETNSDDLGTYLTSDPKGKLAIPYLTKLAASIDARREETSQELHSILKNVDHIKDIVRSQQSYAGAFGLIETCEPNLIFHDALSFVLDSMQRHNITIKEDFESVGSVQVEKSRLIQVLVNLIKNAKEALLMSNVANPQITLRVKNFAQGMTRFQVTDNGIGIAAEHLTKIFSQGFTTKSSGHGFGLHASANLAKEIGGNLSVASEGLGHGATFSVDIPSIRAKSQGTKSNSHLLSKLIGTEVPMTFTPHVHDH